MSLNVSEAKVGRLKMAAEAYERAQLGQLNATADELRAACIDLGYERKFGLGTLDWARDWLKAHGR